MSSLPPLEDPVAYVVVGPNDQRGPYTLELLVSEVAAGRLADTTPVWWPGLADWTTLGVHPETAVLIETRRNMAAPAPEWAQPAPAPAPAPAPTPAAYAAPAPAAETFAAPAPAPVEPAQVEVVEIVETIAVAELVADDGTVVTEIVDVTDFLAEDGSVVAEILDVTEIVEIDPQTLADYEALVARSSQRANLHEQMELADESLVLAVITAAGEFGFGLDDRTDLERSHELRFGEASGDLLEIELGRVAAQRPEDVRFAHVPLTVSYRSGTYQGEADPGDGSHGAVTISADEWTGQSASAASLFLDLHTYFDEDLSVDFAAVQRDLGATIAVVRGKLS